MLRGGPPKVNCPRCTGAAALVALRKRGEENGWKGKEEQGLLDHGCWQVQWYLDGRQWLIASPAGEYSTNQR